MTDAAYWRTVAQELHRQLLAATDAAWDGPIYWLPVRSPVTPEELRGRTETLRSPGQSAPYWPERDPRPRRAPRPAPARPIHRLDRTPIAPRVAWWRRCSTGYVAEAPPDLGAPQTPAQPLRAWGVGDLVVPAPECGHVPLGRGLPEEPRCRWCGATVALDDAGWPTVIAEGVAEVAPVCPGCAVAVPGISLRAGIPVVEGILEGVG